MSRAGQDGSHRHHQTDLFIVDITNHTPRGADHLHGVLFEQFVFVINKLCPEAVVG